MSMHHFFLSSAHLLHPLRSCFVRVVLSILYIAILTLNSSQLQYFAILSTIIITFSISLTRFLCLIRIVVILCSFRSVIVPRHYNHLISLKSFSLIYKFRVCILGSVFCSSVN